MTTNKNENGTTKLVDPRVPIKKVHMPAHDRKVFRRLRRDRVLLRAVCQLLAQYKPEEIISAVGSADKLPILRRRMLAKFGVLSATDEDRATMPFDREPLPTKKG